MRSHDVLTLLDYEAKREPALAALMGRIDDLTEADIERAPVKMPWMRQALLKLKQQKQNALAAASVLEGVIDSQTADPAGEMRRWNGESAFVRIGRTALEITDGQLIWFGQSGVWIDTIYTTTIDPLLHSRTTACGRVTRSAYLQEVRDRLSQMTPTPVAQPPGPMSGVRFYCPGN